MIFVVVLLSEVELEIYSKARDRFELFVEVLDNIVYFHFGLVKLLLGYDLFPIAEKDTAPSAVLSFKFRSILHFYQRSKVAFDGLQFFLDLLGVKCHFALLLKIECYLIGNLIFVHFLEFFFLLA